MKKYEKQLIDFKLYMITDSAMCAPDQFDRILNEAVHSGVKAFQLREKKISGLSLFNLTNKVKSICAGEQTNLFINDRVDIAMAAGTTGVHLTSKSLSVRQTREIVGDALLVGASTHSLGEIEEAEEDGCDFVLFGPVYETESKKQYGPPQGLDKLNEVSRKTQMPVFAVGGIDSNNARHCLDSGAHGVAVISAIMKSKNIAATCNDFRRSLGTL